nr:phage tail protein [Sporomusa sphaeroides]
MSSLQGTFSGIEDRAAAVEVVFSDNDNDFKSSQFLVKTPDWNTNQNYQDNPAQLQLFGVKRKSQAYREGVYTLANNKYVTQFVDISTDIDAMVCEYGDIVGLNHSVSQMGIISGRIISADTNTVTLDKTISLSPEIACEIIIQLSVNDELVKKTIVGVSETMETDTLTVSEPFAVIPQKYDNYAFGEVDKSAKPFRLVGVQRSGELKCKLSLAEYVEGVYSGDLNYPLIDYTPPGSTIYEVSGLNIAEENYLTSDGIRVSLLHASWTLERSQQADAFFVYYSTDGNDWRVWERTTEMRSTIRDINPGRIYYVKVSAVKEPILSTGVVKSLYITGRDALPPDVLTLMVEKLASGSYRFSFTTDGIPVDLAGYRVKYNVGNSTWWQTAIPLLSGLVRSSPFELAGLPPGIITVLVKGVDNAGNESKNVAYTVLNSGDSEIDNIIWELDFYETLFSGDKNNCSVNSDGYLVADDNGEQFWTEGDNASFWMVDDRAVFWKATYKTMVYTASFIPEQSGYFNIQFEGVGPAQIFYRRRFPQPFWTNDIDYFWSNDSAMFWPDEAPYTPYNGKVQTTGEIHDIRVIIDGGSVQGIIKSLKAIVDVPDEVEIVNDLFIPAAGIRVPLTKSYRSIKSVRADIQDDGDAEAIGSRIIDRSILGPLIKLVNGNNAAVAGVADITIQGVRG